jgi:hypothetical protein
MLAHPFHQLSPIAPLNPEQPQFFTGAAEPCTQQAGPSGVGHRSGRDQYGHQEAQGINQQRALAPFAVFAFVVAAFPAQCHGLDTVAIEAASRGMFVAPSLLAHLGAQGVVEALPVPAVAPLTARPVHTGPLWLLMGEHAPCDAPVNDIKNGIEHRPHIQCAVASPRFGWWDQIFDTLPFGISEVCGVWIGVHPQSVLN